MRPSSVRIYILSLLNQTLIIFIANTFTKILVPFSYSQFAVLFQYHLCCFDVFYLHSLVLYKHNLILQNVEFGLSVGVLHMHMYRLEK